MEPIIINKDDKAKLDHKRHIKTHIDATKKVCNCGQQTNAYTLFHHLKSNYHLLNTSDLLSPIEAGRFFDIIVKNDYIECKNCKTYHYYKKFNKHKTSCIMPL